MTTALIRKTPSVVEKLGRPRFAYPESSPQVGLNRLIQSLKDGRLGPPPFRCCWLVCRRFVRRLARRPCGKGALTITPTITEIRSAARVYVDSDRSLSASKPATQWLWSFTRSSGKNGLRHGPSSRPSALEARRQRRRLSLLACRLGEGRRSRGATSIMESKTLAHWCTVSMEGEKPRENPLSLASLRSWGLVKNGLRVSPTLFPRPSNARRTNARK